MIKKISQRNLKGCIILSCLLIFGVNACNRVEKELFTQEPSLSIGTFDGQAAPTKLVVPANKSLETFSIVSNANWKITKQGASTSWVTLAPEEGSMNGEVTVFIAQNTGTEPRELTLHFTLNGLEEIVRSMTISQLGFIPGISVVPASTEVLGKTGGDITFTVTTNNDEWNYTIENGSEWLTQKEKTATSLTLTATGNPGFLRSANIVFSLPNHPNVSAEAEIVQEGELIADLLDVVFNLDGTATDRSPTKHTVHKINHSFPFTVSYSDTYRRNMVTFKPASNGGNPTSSNGSWYRVDYDTDFEDILATGHSFECLVQFDVDYSTSRTYETKFFSTQQTGGTGFLIANSTQSTGTNGLTFLPNVPTNEGGASTWRWANSQVKPDGQSWYHLVGIWDKVAGKSFIYVNGEKKAEVDAPGHYRPTPSDTKWIALGGDPGPTNNIQNTYEGSMAIARIYGRALTATEVSYLWNQAKPND